MMWATPIYVKKILDDDDKEESYDDDYDDYDDEKDDDNEGQTNAYDDFHSIDYNAFQWLHLADQYICHDGE